MTDYDALLAGYSDMYARGIWDWKEYEKMRDLALHWEQIDLRALLAPCGPFAPPAVSAVTQTND